MVAWPATGSNRLEKVFWEFYWVNIYYVAHKLCKFVDVDPPQSSIYVIYKLRYPLYSHICYGKIIRSNLMFFISDVWNQFVLNLNALKVPCLIGLLLPPVASEVVIKVTNFSQ